PIEASITLLGILLATIGAMRAWRLQKRDEILLQSLAEIQAFFEQVSNAAGELNAYLALLKNLQSELRAGPYSLDAYWRSTYLDEQASDARGSQKLLRKLAVDVYALDSRNVHAMT